MTTATAKPALTVTPALAVSRGFPGLRCPSCGAEDSIALCLDNGQLFCRENECEFEREDVEAQVRGWTRVLQFLDALPTID